MVRHSVPHNSSSLWARSDRPTGHTTKTSKVATCLPLGPFTLAEKSPTMTRAFLIGRPKSLWIFMDTIQKKGKGQQDVVIGAMYRGACQHTALAMKWHSSPWLKKGWQLRRRNTRLPTAIMLEWKSLPWSGRIWRTRSTWTTRPQRTITTAASDHALRIDTQVGDRTKSWQQCCRCVLLDFFGTTRKPELTFLIFLGKPGPAFHQKSTVASICNWHLFNLFSWLFHAQVTFLDSSKLYSTHKLPEYH